MSRESCGVTPIRGMALPGKALCGSWIHKAMFSGELLKKPAIQVRVPTCSSGGPTLPVASTTPGIRWHPPQPYCLIKSIPRLGSPETFTGLFSDFASHPDRKRQASVSARSDRAGALMRMAGAAAPRSHLRDVRIRKTRQALRSTVHIRLVRRISCASLRAFDRS
jgi:hypothetical protein